MRSDNVYVFDKAYITKFVSQAVKVFDESGKEAAKRFIKTKKYPTRLKDDIQIALNKALEKRKGRDGF